MKIKWFRFILWFILFNKKIKNNERFKLKYRRRVCKIIPLSRKLFQRNNPTNNPSKINQFLSSPNGSILNHLELPSINEVLIIPPPTHHHKKNKYNNLNRNWKKNQKNIESNQRRTKHTHNYWNASNKSSTGKKAINLKSRWKRLPINSKPYSWNN